MQCPKCPNPEFNGVDPCEVCGYVPPAPKPPGWWGAPSFHGSGRSIVPKRSDKSPPPQEPPKRFVMAFPYLSACPECLKVTLFHEKTKKRYKCLNQECGKAFAEKQLEAESKHVLGLYDCPKCKLRSVAWSIKLARWECANIHCRYVPTEVEQDQFVGGSISTDGGGSAEEDDVLSEVVNKIQHIMLEFQIGDIRKALWDAKANFLVAIGCVVATEFLGGLLTGTLGVEGGSKERFIIGFKYLGEQYANLADNTLGDIYTNLRCGLVHQYLPDGTEGIYAGSQIDAPGVIVAEGRFKIVCDSYIRELENAVNRLIAELESNPERLRNCQQALASIPELE